MKIVLTAKIPGVCSTEFYLRTPEGEIRMCALVVGTDDDYTVYLAEYPR